MLKLSKLNDLRFGRIRHRFVPTKERSTLTDEVMGANFMFYMSKDQKSELSL